MTDLERQVIEGIFNSDYQDGNVGEEAVNHPVWTFDVVDRIAGNKASRGGAVASCVKKGYVSLSSYDKKDDAIEVTRAGYDAYIAAFGPFKSRWND